MPAMLRPCNTITVLTLYQKTFELRTNDKYIITSKRYIVASCPALNRSRRGEARARGSQLRRMDVKTKLMHWFTIMSYINVRFIFCIMGIKLHCHVVHVWVTF